jgi:hypothetical protein
MGTMSDLKRRLKKLDGRRRRPTHRRSVLLVPAEVGRDWEAWFWDSWPCACGGGIDCPEKELPLVVVPEPATSMDEWYRRYQAEFAKTAEQRQAEAEAWYARFSGEESHG